jgi:hypothetical protein
VAIADCLLQKVMVCSAASGPGKLAELPPEEIACESGNNIQKLAFSFGISKFH